MYANPIVIDGTMYLSTPSLKAVALDAATGRQKWVFDPAKYNNGVVMRLRNRGVAYWKGAEGERILRLCPGPCLRHGCEIGPTDPDLRKGRLHRPPRESRRRPQKSRARNDHAGRGLQEPAHPRLARQRDLRLVPRPHPRLRHRHGTVEMDLSHDPANPASSVTTPGRGPRGKPSAARTPGAASPSTRSAAGSSPQPARPRTTSMAASAKGKICFQIASWRWTPTTGKLKWHYQTVHHDLWDYDNPPAPILVTVKTARRVARCRGAAHQDGTGVRARPGNR